MTPERLASMGTRTVAFDCETHLIQPGLVAPPLVCASVAALGDNGINGKLLDKATAREWFAELVCHDSKRVMVGANIAYDMLVMAVDAAKRGVDLMPAIFAAYEAGRVFDVQIAEALHAIAGGHLGKMPDGSPLLSATGKIVHRYSLEQCVKLVLDRSNAKENDKWRLSYALLENKPIDRWPHEARQYPIDDAVNTLEVALVQAGVTTADGFEQLGESKRRNLHDLAAQCYAAWCLHLGAAWGLRTDGASIDVLESAARELAARGLDEFKAAGFVREDGSEDGAVVKRAVALAYGCTGECPECAGARKVPGSRGPKYPVNCKACSATGLDLSTAPVPRTDKGAVQAGRDVLIESGDDLLMEYAAASEDDKILSSYVPFLREGVSTPITLRPNAVLDTGRVSYDGVVQLLPRQVSARLAQAMRARGVYPGVRERIIPRPGHVFFSVDYSGGELVTFAEACVARVGFSVMGQQLNAGRDVHSLLASEILGISYDEFLQRKKEKRCKDMRQAAKPINFGCPGGIGAAKIVLQQRKQGPDTPHPSGPSEVWDSGTFVKGYKGLRFCILVDGADACGVDKVTDWNGNPIPPTCRGCLEVATRLRNAWFKQWPEAREYLSWHANNVDTVGEVEQLYSRRIRGGTTFTSESNGDFQALLADIAKRALCRVQREAFVERKSPLWGARVIVFAHDELFGEVPEARASDAAHRIVELMVDEFRKGCPNHAAACKAEPALARAWYKAMEPVYVDGKLVPWEPK